MNKCDHYMALYAKKVCMMSLNDFQFQGYEVDFRSIKVKCSCGEWV